MPGDTEKLKYIDPFFIVPLVMAGMADLFGFVLLPILTIPVFGIIFYSMASLFHWFVSLLIAFVLFPQLKHFVPKLILAIGMIIPLPWLSGAIILAIISQNRAIEFLITQAGIAAIGAATGGLGAAAGEAAEVAAGVEEGAAITGEVLEAGEAATEGAAGAARGLAEAGEATTGAAVESVGGVGEEAAETSLQKGVRKFEDIRDRYDQWENPDGSRAQRMSKDEEEAEEEEMAGIPNVEGEAMAQNFPDINNTINNPVAANDNTPYAANDNENVTIKNNNRTVDLRKNKKDDEKLAA